MGSCLFSAACLVRRQRRCILLQSSLQRPAADYQIPKRENACSELDGCIQPSASARVRVGWAQRRAGQDSGAYSIIYVHIYYILPKIFYTRH
jgi:hypothetical protein